jgi:23S rRNA (guanosine2251-2'-O)-methyltransferase
MPDKLTLEGHLSVLAALENLQRPIESVYLQQGKRIRSAAQLKRAAAARSVSVHEVPAAEIDDLSAGRTHGGVLALAGSRQYLSLGELVSDTPTPFVAMLDGVEDPFNFGQAIRALYAAGAQGLVLPPRDWENALNVVARASAGASERIPTARAADSLETVHFFKEHGYLAAAADKSAGSLSIYEADLAGPLFLLVGGERRGLPAATLKACDLLLRIPYARPFNPSLDVTSSTAAIAFEIMRQRSLK